MVKDEHHKTRTLTDGDHDIGLTKRQDIFVFIYKIQEEVHRFAITFHREKRSKSQIASALDHIKGVGDKRKTALLKTFKSVARIRQASLEEIAEVIGESAAKSVKESLSESK